MACLGRAVRGASACIADRSKVTIGPNFRPRRAGTSFPTSAHGCYTLLVRPSTRFLWALWLVAAACQHADAEPRPSLAKPASPSGSRKTTPPASAPTSLSASGSWVDAFRAGRYAEAARSLDALGGEIEKRPELVFARARAALEIRDFERAAALSKNLETRLPVLEERVRRLRA